MRGFEGLQSVLTAPGQFSSQSAPHRSAGLLSRQPLCGDQEGWGPVSDLRWDLTPCFLDVWIIGVALWGVLFGAGALWYLFAKRIAQDVPRNWHFYTKLYVVSALCALRKATLTPLQGCYRCHRHYHRRPSGTTDRTPTRDMV